MPVPSIGRIVHYVSYGTPGGEYKSQCRAAIVTSAAPRKPGENDSGLVEDSYDIGLCVLNPEGQFFNQLVPYDAGGETAGAQDCPNKQQHGDPFRYCSCGWMEAAYRGGSWHWPEQVAE